MARRDPRTRNLAFTDTETTGLDSDEHEIISLALVLRTPDGVSLRRREWFMHPRWPEKADAKALEINGYTHEGWEARGVVSHEKAMREYCKLCEGAIFVAHNVPFNWGMLKKEWSRHIGVRWSGDYHTIDTASLAWKPYIELNGALKSVSLNNLCAYYGTPNEGAHDALTDVDRTIEAYDNMMEDSWTDLLGKLFGKLFG